MFHFDLQLFASKKGAGSTRNGRDSNAQRLGMKKFGGQVVINPITCIGCRACYNNCPYDAIRMVEIRDPSGEFMVDQDMKPISKAKGAVRANVQRQPTLGSSISAHRFAGSAT